MSDLIQSTKSSVFELLRPPAPTTTNNVNNNSDSDNICSRLRSRKRIAQQPRQPQRKKRRTACGGIMNLVQPEDEEEDTEVILNKADEIESLQVGNNRNFKMKKIEYMVSYSTSILHSANFPAFFYWLMTATALQQTIKTLENWQKGVYQLCIQISQCIKKVTF